MHFKKLNDCIMSHAIQHMHGRSW